MTIPYKSVIEWNNEFVAFMTARSQQPNFCASVAIREWLCSPEVMFRVFELSLEDESFMMGLAMACEHIGRVTEFNRSHPLNETVAGGSKEG